MAGILTALLTQGFGFFHLVAAIFGAYFSYHTVLILYRLSPFHPLARFPGPRISHATQWYRTYYEVFKGGVMSKQLKKLHEVYGELQSLGDLASLAKQPQAPS